MNKEKGKSNGQTYKKKEEAFQREGFNNDER